MTGVPTQTGNPPLDIKLRNLAITLHISAYLGPFTATIRGLLTGMDAVVDNNTM